jgi:hypothetical protein
MTQQVHFYVMFDFSVRLLCDNNGDECAILFFEGWSGSKGGVNF